MEKTLLTWKDHRDLLFLCKGHWDSESLSASAAVTQLVNCRRGSAVQISELAVHAFLAPHPTKDWLYYTALDHLHKDDYCLSCLDGRFARNHPNAHSLDAMLPMASLCEHRRSEAGSWVSLAPGLCLGTLETAGFPCLHILFVVKVRNFFWNYCLQERYSFLNLLKFTWITVLRTLFTSRKIWLNHKEIWKEKWLCPTVLAHLRC